MHIKKPRYLRFSLNSIFLLSLGIAIGYAWNLWVWRVKDTLGSEAVMFRMPTYIIEPPDVLRIDVAGNSSEAPVISGEHLVAMDGRVNLGKYGSVYLAGYTMEQAANAIEMQVAKQLDQPTAAVDVAEYNSKIYYVIVEGCGRGDCVTRVPCTGDETALDAIAAVDGLDTPDEKEIWISRPAPNGRGAQKIIPIDYVEITRGAAPRRNYQIYPGDRVFISHKKAATAPIGSAPTGKLTSMPPDPPKSPPTSEYWRYDSP